LELVGVTGTNGKTTVAALVAQLARGLGWNGDAIGTLTHERTTPAPPELFRAMARAASGFTPRERSVLALEVSSHALVQGRVDGLTFAVAAFTNLGHDHLDYHASLEDYFAAKASLFRPERARRAVVWVDDPYGARLADDLTVPLTRVSLADASSVERSWLGTTFFWRGQLVSTGLVGGYHVDNALVAMAILSALGASDDAIARAMGSVSGVPGRFEVVHRGAVTVVVDYAHTPEGLERLLADARELTGSGRLTVVFGCGGDRDRDKRPLMGAVASRGADEVVVTSDNPRGESPDAIIDAVIAGADPATPLTREVDRRRAIEGALARAGAGDVVVVAGKGHETTQIVGGAVVDFDDRVVARECLAARC
ncbi:MAG: Mur ligase family protein, partial [Acidimicrobiales bacterium]